MKPERSLADRAARILRDEAEAPSEVAQEARGQAVAGIVRAMRLRKRQRRVRWGAFGAVSLAAAVAVALGLGRQPQPAAGGAPLPSGASSASAPRAAAAFVRGAPVVVRRGARTTVSEGTPIEPGDRLLVEPGSRTTIALVNGTYVAVEDRADLALSSAGPTTIFELASGSVRADVAKLTAGERFVIRTADAEIEVHGTSFEIARVPPDPSCGGGTTTRVKVREGVVAVRAGGAETRLRANESWPVGCAPPREPPSAGPPAPAASASVEGPGRAPAAAAPLVPRAVATGASEKRAEESADADHAVPAPASDLARQNDLFEGAIARKRAGDAAAAVAGFEDLLARYPTSHLAQSARAERMKLLREVDPVRARAAATDYLERHPSGFARRDAELILSGQ